MMMMFVIMMMMFLMIVFFKRTWSNSWTAFYHDSVFDDGDDVCDDGDLKFHCSLYFRQSMGCAWWTLLRFIPPPMKKAMGTEEKNYGFSWKCETPKNLRRTWVFEPQNFKNLKTQTSALNLNPRFWNSKSWILFGKREKKPKLWIQNLPKPAPISGCVTSELFAYNHHMMIVHMIIWSLYNHHRIIIWSQRLDVMRKKGGAESSKYVACLLRGFAESRNVCFRKQR